MTLTETADVPTPYGSPPFAGLRSGVDSVLVAARGDRHDRHRKTNTPGRRTSRAAVSATAGLMLRRAAADALAASAELSKLVDTPEPVRRHHRVA
jgi:hypothetical protein